jgi:hypothetical protein
MDCLHDRFLASEIRWQRVFGRQADAHRTAMPKGGTASPRACIFAPFIETRNIKAGFLRLCPGLILFRPAGRADFPADSLRSATKFKRLRNSNEKPDARPVAS